MTTFLVPLQNVPQQFSIALGGRELLITSRWNSADDAGWVLDISDNITTEVLATNIPLIAGADCLAGLEYLEINGLFVVFTDGNQSSVPTLDNLGVESNLYFQTDVT